VPTTSRQDSLERVAYAMPIRAALDLRCPLQLAVISDHAHAVT
jgi:competence protein ComGF